MNKQEHKLPVLYTIPVGLVTYANWFVAILSAAYGYLWLGALIVIPICLVFWVLYHYIVGYSCGLSTFIISLLAVGLIVDTAANYWQLIDYHANAWAPVIPIWMFALWLNFSLAAYIFFKKFFRYTMFIFIILWLGIAFSYWSGVAFGAAGLPKGMMGLWLHSLVLAIVLTTICWWFAKRATSE